MAGPFTIRIFVPDGDPEGVLIIDRMNWTGLVLVFPRAKWPDIRKRPEMLRTGVYVLDGYKNDEDDLPTIYVGQADSVGGRIQSHFTKKDFWDRGVVFVSSSDGLNRAHVTWLEHALIKRAAEVKRYHLDNGNAPQEPGLSEAEKADTQGFLNEILQILPLVGLRAFKYPKAVVTPPPPVPPHGGGPLPSKPDTIVVPAQKKGFDEVFLGQDCWYAIRISGGMLDKIKLHRRIPIATGVGDSRTMPPSVPHRVLRRGRKVQGHLLGKGEEGRARSRMTMRQLGRCRGPAIPAFPRYRRPPN